jgi:hypothetical protein
MSRGVCVLSPDPVIDRLLQIIEVGVKPVDGLRFGCFSSGLEILKSVTQIGMAIFESGKVGIARGSFANALDFLSEFLGSIVECKVPGHLRYRSREGGVWRRSVHIVVLGMISRRGAGGFVPDRPGSRDTRWTPRSGRSANSRWRHALILNG